MPDKSPPEFPPSQDPAKPETSLADLLPDLFETPPAPQNSPSSGPPPLPPRQKYANFLPLIIAAVIGMIIVPLIIIGVFIFIANSQPVPTTIDVAQANTPLATVFSITPVPTGPTRAGSPAPAKSAGASQCPPQAAFGPVDYYSCSQPVQAGSAFTAYFGLAELQLAQNGQNGPGVTRLYSVTGDSPAKVMQFYAASLAAQGYTPSNPTATGATPLGPYSAALYAKGTQQVQVMALTVNKASPDGQVKAGQTLIRLSSS